MTTCLFVIEPKRKSMGIVVVMIALEQQQTLFCNVRILPLSSLSDIAEQYIKKKQNVS